MNLWHVTKAFAVLALVGTTLVATPAEARFGKRSSAPAKSNNDPDSKSKNKSASTTARSAGSSSSSTHAATAVPSRAGSSRVHGATAVGASPRPSPRVHVEHYHSDACAHAHSSGYVYVAPAPVYVAQPGVTYYPAQESRGADEFRFDLGLTGQVMKNGGMVGAQLRVDFERLGFDLRADRMALLADDGSEAFDTLSLANAGLTWSLLNGSHGRLRAHGGVYSVIAPDAVFVGPGGGLSATVELLGPFTLEADAQAVVFPFTELDAHAGLGLKLGPVEGRAGMRMTYLNDQGRVDGEAHSDTIVGPYVGLALVL